MSRAKTQGQRICDFWHRTLRCVQLCMRAYSTMGNGSNENVCQQRHTNHVTKIRLQLAVNGFVQLQTRSIKKKGQHPNSSWKSQSPPHFFHNNLRKRKQKKKQSATFAHFKFLSRSGLNIAYYVKFYSQSRTKCSFKFHLISQIQKQNLLIIFFSWCKCQPISHL